MTRIAPLFCVIAAFLLLAAPAQAEPWYCRFFPWLKACRQFEHQVPRVTNLKAKANTGVPPP
jgi:hypothetical protein